MAVANKFKWSLPKLKMAIADQFDWIGFVRKTPLNTVFIEVCDEITYDDMGDIAEFFNSGDITVEVEAEIEDYGYGCGCCSGDPEVVAVTTLVVREEKDE